MVSGDKSEMFKKVQMLTLKEGIKKMKNVNESGRSMVEMLGVLAIIGVLSIGGIAGYTLAMNRYRANEALQAASLVAIEAIAQNKAIASTALDGLSLPAGITSVGADADGIVTIQVATGYDSVGKLIGDLAGNRKASGCTGEGECKLDMRKAAKAADATGTN